MTRRDLTSALCNDARKFKGTIPDKTPFELDTESKVQEPFDFQQWIDQNRDVINEKGRLAVFDSEKHQFQV